MKKGFTFIELIIVIAIILVLSVAIIVNYNSYTDRERVRQSGLTMKSDLRLVASKVNAGVKPAACTMPVSYALVSYEVTFITTCSDGRSCYTITPRCSNGLISDEQRTVYIPKELHIQSANQTIRFLPLSAGTDLATDAVITLGGVSTVYHVKISPSGTISDY
jgi:prepilin-type N-terminal cleavage/methylation domain-containing protein